MLQDAVIKRLLSKLTQQEQANSIAYLSVSPIPAGTSLKFPRLAIDVQQSAWVAFIDRQPQSDWGHSCRYLLIDDETGETHSFEAQFPPFRPESPWKWRIVYEASTHHDPAVST